MRKRKDKKNLDKNALKPARVHPRHPKTAKNGQHRDKRGKN